MTHPRPNLFIVGAPKCGTTALAEYLGDRADVCFSRPKELHHFGDDTRPARLLPEFRFDSDDDYAAHFARQCGGEPVVGEGSTLALSSETACGEMLAFNPDARFVAMVRDPVDLFRSWHAHLCNHFYEDVTDPARAWDLQETRARGDTIPETCDDPPLLQYRHVASVGTQLARFFEVVPEPQRLVLIFEEFRDDPGAAYRTACDFLGLPDDGRETFPVVNEARTYSSAAVGRFLLKPPPAVQAVRRKLAAWAGVETLGLRSVVDRFVRRPSPKPPFPESLRNRLAAEFADEAALAARVLGRGLPWRSARRHAVPAGTGR